jgi:hypothetical protein
LLSRPLGLCVGCSIAYITLWFALEGRRIRIELWSLFQSLQGDAVRAAPAASIPVE